MPSAGGAAEALTQLRAVDTALMITDILMPRMTGIELAHSAREICPEMSIIVMTGKSDTASAISAIRAGADDYIVKPFDFEEMFICIERALEKAERKPKLFRARMSNTVHFSDCVLSNATFTGANKSRGGRSFVDRLSASRRFTTAIASRKLFSFKR